MIIRKTVCRVFLSLLPAIFFATSLWETFDQESLFPAFAPQISCFTADNESFLEKKKKSPAIGHTAFICEVDEVQDKLFDFIESFLTLPIIFSYFLRAPPIA